MTELTIAAPGTPAGPCTKHCPHYSCSNQRAIATTHCTLCHQPIGYDRKFRHANHKLVHTSCLHDLHTQTQPTKGNPR